MSLIVLGAVILVMGMSFVLRGGGAARNASQLRSAGFVILIAGAVILVVSIVVALTPGR